MGAQSGNERFLCQVYVGHWPKQSGKFESHATKFTHFTSSHTQFKGNLVRANL